ALPESLLRLGIHHEGERGFVSFKLFPSPFSQLRTGCLLSLLFLQLASQEVMHVVYRQSPSGKFLAMASLSKMILFLLFLPQEGDSLGTMEKLCRQLTYHLSPHSQWRRQGMVKRKPQACLKTILVGNPLDNTVDLSGIPLTMKELDRVISYIQHSSEYIENVELCFTELTDEMFLQLLPVLCALPRLATLSLNGNRLTKAVLRDLTEALKDTRNFPSMTWIDLGNNVDIFSLPQPFLVSLKKRSPTQSNLPTILEFGESQVSDLERFTPIPTSCSVQYPNQSI
uniref:Leucine rich repeat containing 75A n=1 Tax=Laticauda laticaudata TaxID=8630 RepID=A0A8C5RG41_LATLA